MAGDRWPIRWAAESMVTSLDPPLIMPRIRFSLRELLALVTVLAILLAFGGNRMRSARRQRHLITLIQWYGGEDHHDFNFRNATERMVRVPNTDFCPALPGPVWLRKCIGDEYFVNVAEAFFFDKSSHRVLDDAMLLDFAEAIRAQTLPRPRGLVFADVLVTDVGLTSLSTFPDLTSLHIINCPDVTDAGLMHIELLTKLRRLDLRGSSVTDRGLARLSHLKELRELSLKRTAVTDGGLAHLVGLTNLKWLGLSDTSVTIAAIKTLKQRLPNCAIRTQRSILPPTQPVGRVGCAHRRIGN